MGSFRLRQCLKSYGDEMAPAFGPIGPRVRHLVRTLKMTFTPWPLFTEQQWNYNSTSTSTKRIRPSGISDRKELMEPVRWAARYCEY